MCGSLYRSLRLRQQGRILVLSQRVGGRRKVSCRNVPRGVKLSYGVVTYSRARGGVRAVSIDAGVDRMRPEQRTFSGSA